MLPGTGAAGDFRTEDPWLAAVQILVVLDGLGAHANTDRSNRPPTVTSMAAATAERELQLPAGTLTAPGSGRPGSPGQS